MSQSLEEEINELRSLFAKLSARVDGAPVSAGTYDTRVLTPEQYEEVMTELTALRRFRDAMRKAVDTGAELLPSDPPPRALPAPVPAPLTTTVARRKARARISPECARVLALLDKAGALTIAELIERTDESKSWVHLKVHALEDAGLVRVDRDAHDYSSNRPCHRVHPIGRA